MRRVIAATIVWSVWAGVVPLKLIAGDPIDDDRLGSGINVPEYAQHYSRSRESNHGH